MFGWIKNWWNERQARWEAGLSDREKLELQVKRLIKYLDNATWANGRRDIPAYLKYVFTYTEEYLWEYDPCGNKRWYEIRPEERDLEVFTPLLVKWASGELERDILAVREARIAKERSSLDAIRGAKHG